MFCQILNQELDSAVGTRPDTKLCQILDQEPNTFPGTKSSSSGTKLSTLNIMIDFSYKYNNLKGIGYYVFTKNMKNYEKFKLLKIIAFFIN